MVGEGEGWRRADVPVLTAQYLSSRRTHATAESARLIESMVAYERGPGQRCVPWRAADVLLARCRPSSKGEGRSSSDLKLANRQHGVELVVVARA